MRRDGSPGRTPTPNPMLQKEHSVCFEVNEYVLIRDFFSPAQSEAFRAHADRMGTRAEELLRLVHETGRAPAELARQLPGDLIVVAERDSPHQLCRFEYLIGASADFGRLVAEQITPLVSEVAGEPYVPFKDKQNMKAPGGGGFPPHQDFPAYQLFPPRYTITAMISIDPATKQNGSLEFARNFAALSRNPAFVREWIGDTAMSGGKPIESSRAVLHWHEGGARNGDLRDDIVAQGEWELIETGPRDLVIFSSFAPHSSGTNRSGGCRRAIFIVHSPLRSGDWYDTYYADKRANVGLLWCMTRWFAAASFQRSGSPNHREKLRRRGSTAPVP